jgi:hypothetical protein
MSDRNRRGLATTARAERQRLVFCGPFQVQAPALAKSQRTDFDAAPGAFGRDAITEMGEVAAFEELRDTGEPDVVRGCLATRIIAAARRGERDPARLLEAALRRSGWAFSGVRSLKQPPLAIVYTAFNAPATSRLRKSPPSPLPFFGGRIRLELGAQQ